MRYIANLALASLLLACSAPATTDDDQAPSTPSTPTTSTPRSNTAERDSWQKPQEVFMLMGNDLR
ncbi:MAG TPA: hypothetical protein PL070_05845, partial [Flavobacteriales bacterium]|nr:hypothetical protein [Flavobacteriales bacterium]